jgi:hypothetical protein
MKVVKLEVTDLKDPYANEAVITVNRKVTQGGQMYMTDKAREMMGLNDTVKNVGFAYVRPEDSQDILVALMPTAADSFEMLNLTTKNMNKVNAAKVDEKTNGFTSARIHEAICAQFKLNAHVVEGEERVHRFRITPAEGNFFILSHINPKEVVDTTNESN